MTNSGTKSQRNYFNISFVIPRKIFCLSVWLQQCCFISCHTREQRHNDAHISLNKQTTPTWFMLELHQSKIKKKKKIFFHFLNLLKTDMKN